MRSYDVIIIGGGAAGFFTAINIAEQAPHLKLCILERSKSVLSKVKVSGGGRCNVTHAEFIPDELVRYYPRGEKELLGPFHTFMTGDTMAWFETRGVPLKIEEDGRIFPESNTSQAIIDCFLHLAEQHGIAILKSHLVERLEPGEEWTVTTNNGEFNAPKVMVATGSNKKMWHQLRVLGLQLVPPVPSLFTFDIKDPRIEGIPGVVVQDTEVHVLGTSLQSEGPVLITHVGLSAPAILKLSAFGALELATMDYQFEIAINFIKKSKEETLEALRDLKAVLARKTLYKAPQFEIPKRLWYKLLEAASVSKDTRWADLTKKQMEALQNQLTAAVFKVTGKSTFKEEFVTAGGLDLKELNFKTYESKQYPNLYFAGEVLNIDALTGGFNFQNAWTGGYIAAKAIINDEH